MVETVGCPLTLQPRTITLHITPTSGCSFGGGFWALSPVQSLAHWPPMPEAPSQGRSMASSAPGMSFGLTLTRPGSYYPASWVRRSDAGSWDVFHPVLKQMLLGPQTPGKGLGGQILAVPVFDLPSPSFRVLNPSWEGL